MNPLMVSKNNVTYTNSMHGPSTNPVINKSVAKNTNYNRFGSREHRNSNTGHEDSDSANITPKANYFGQTQNSQNDGASSNNNQTGMRTILIGSDYGANMENQNSSPRTGSKN
jgi:hypothetical protein